MTIPEFFNHIEEGEEYLTLFCTKGSYSQIPKHLTVVISSVRQKNESFKDDEIHKDLVKKLSKARRELSDYEYLKNNS